MITTNLPQFVQALKQLGLVHVHDSQDRIELTLAKPVDVERLDDLVCDALFADPLSRREDRKGWTVELYKRTNLRGASDMQALPDQGIIAYSMQPAA